LSIDPKHVTALDDKGLALDHLGNRTGADKALAMDPKFEGALYDKGLVLDKLRNYTGALTYIRLWL
jgi:hypothetical protein